MSHFSAKIAHQILTYAFIVLLAFTPLFFITSTEEIFEFNKMCLVYGLTIAVAGAWAVKMLSERKIIWAKTFFDLPLVLFYLSQLAATLFSMHPWTSIFGYYARFNAGLLPLTCYLILYYALVSNFKVSDLKRLFKWTFIAAFLVSLWGILEHFGHSFSCLLINFDSVLDNSLSLSEAFSVTCWV